MKRTILSLVSVTLLAPAGQTSARAQTPAPAAARPSAPFVPAPAQNGPIPTVAFDITKADIDFVLKNAPANPPDRQLRVVDMGKYNLGVGIIHRGPTNDKPGEPISGDLPRLHAGGVHHHVGQRRADDRRRDREQARSTGVPNVMNGPSGGGTAGAGAYSRVVKEGDIIIIPTMRGAWVEPDQRSRDVSERASGSRARAAVGLCVSAVVEESADASAEAVNEADAAEVNRKQKRPLARAFYANKWRGGRDSNPRPLP